MSYCKIGLHIGIGGNRNGFGPNYLVRLSDADRPAVVKSVDDYGGIVETLAYNGDNICVYRKTGGAYENPDYNVTNPVDAGNQHYDRCMAALPPEFDKRTWLEMMNEPDKNRAEWLGQVAEVIATKCLRDGFKFAAFGWSAGEPEREHWLAMLPFLQLASDNPTRIAIALHEYSFDVNDIMAGYPYMLGRFQMLHDICTAHGLDFPTILITEWGWTLDNVPTPEITMQHIAAAQELYGPYDNILGAGLWYLGGGYGGIADKAQRLIDPLGQYAATGDFDYEPPEPPPPPEPGEYDLMEYMAAPAGVQTVLQCDFPNFQGTQTLCTLWKQPPIFYQQKDSEAEFLYYDTEHIYRWWDTSLGMIDGRKAFYEQNTLPDKQGAYWCDRVVQVGQEFGRSPIVTVRLLDDCGIVSQGQQQSGLVVVGHFDSYTFDTGLYIDVPVIELEWRVSGQWEERYWYGFGLGLVRWENRNGLHSWLVEIHTDRPPMAPPNIPACIPTPTLYFEPEEPPEPPSNYARGIDVSRWQGDIDFDVVAGTGVRFVFIRATVGNSYVDPYFYQNFVNAQVAGFIVGVYHVVKPWQSAETQMTHLKSTLGNLVPDLPIALDVELEDGQDKVELTQIVQGCLDLAEELVDPLGRVPIVYTGAWFWNHYIVSGDWSHYPLWVAHYGVDHPFLPIGWDEWLFWQYSSIGSVPGIVGNVDMNFFNGTEQELYDFAQTDMCSGCPGNPRVQFERTYHLLPQDAPLSRVLDVCRIAYQTRGTVGFSWDDAGIGNLDVRYVVAYGFSPEQQTELDDFFLRFYTGVILQFKDYPPTTN